MTMIHLGDKVRDVITGFEGVATGQCVYISGCDQVLLSPPVKEGGDYQTPRWFDVDRCRVVEPAAVSSDDVSNTARPGGDVPAPTK